MSEPRVHTWVTYALIAANVVMFGVELALGAHAANPTPDQMIAVGANYPALTLNGEWWRLGTSMFLHFGLLHIALNMVCLWQGRVVETLFGRGPFAVMYLFAGLVGGVATLVRGGLVVSAGASGAVFGVYGAFGAYLLLRKHTMPEAVWRTTARGIGMFVVINFIFGMAVPSISMTAHVSGLISGFLTGAALLYRTPAAPSLARTAAVAVAGLALAIGTLLVIPKPPLLDLEARSAPPDSLVKFAKVEEAVIHKVNELKKQQRANTLDDTHAVIELERDVLGPWHAGCAALVASESPDARYRALFDSLRDYCAAREESWTTLAAALRATGDDREALLLRHNFEEVEIRKLVNGVMTAQKALDPAAAPK